MPDHPKQPRKDEGERRGFLSRAAGLAMTAGLVGGYGAFAAIAGRFLYPAKPQRKDWMFVVEAAQMAIGDTLLFRGPSGETVNITRKERNGVADDFIALSSTCPHLGCQVHWEPHNERYFCPCHNGEFDSAGVGYAGPPGDADMALPRYPLRVDSGLLFIELPVESLTVGPGDALAGVVGETPEPEVDIHRDAILRPRSFEFTDAVDLLSEEELDCVSPGLHRGWEDRKFSCRRSRTTAREALGASLSADQREHLLILAAYRNRIFRSPPPVSVDTGMVLGAFTTLQQLVGRLSGGAGAG